MLGALPNARLLALLPLTACGTIASSGSFWVPIESHPTGARVFREGSLVGVTPCEAPVTVASRHLTVFMDGFHPQLVDVGTERNPWVAGNFLNLGLGVLIDVALGTDAVPNTSPAIVYLRQIDAIPPIPWTRPPEAVPEPPPPITGAGQVIGGLLKMLVDRANEERHRR